MIYFYLVGCVLFMFLQGFFAAAEISFISTNLLYLRRRHEKGDKRAGRVYKVMSKPDRFLITVLVMINVSLVCIVE